MLPLNFNYQHLQLEKTVQLYGDRAGGQGNFEFAGLAELNKEKILLVHGNQQTLEQAQDWRRLHRLICLAHRLKIPIILWNIPIRRTSTTLHHTSLTLGNVIEYTQTQLIKYPLPIITVFDDNYTWNVIQELGWSDGAVVLGQNQDEQTELLKLKQKLLKNISQREDFQMQIIELLQEVSKINIEVLIANRIKGCSNDQ